MQKPNPRPLQMRRAAICFVLLGGSIGATIVPSRPVYAQRADLAAESDILVTAHPIPPATTPLQVIDGVVNVVGFDGVKENGSGRLTITEQDVAFLTDGRTSTVPLRAITAISLYHTSKPLLRGIAGTLAGLAPNGAGQIYGAIRPGAEMLTLYYRDEDDALHATLILIPKSSKAEVTAAFARAGLSLDQPIPHGTRADGPRERSPSAIRFPNAGGRRPAVTISLPESDGVPLPAAFVAGAYEQLVAQTARSGLFSAVWREGDRRADAAALKMKVRITDFKKGNAGVRGAIPVVGMIAGKTLITATVSLSDAGGSVLLEREVEGSKRMMGESIAATKSLAQRITGAIAKVPGFSKGPAARTVYADDRPRTG